MAEALHWWCPAVLAVLVGAAGAFPQERGSTQPPCALRDNRIIGAGSIATFPGTASATECCSRCLKEPRCKSFTWAKPGVGARSPLDCFLKGNVVDSGADNRTISGYCGAAPPPPPPPQHCVRHRAHCDRAPCAEGRAPSSLLRGLPACS